MEENPEIIVSAWSQRYARAVEVLLKVEGGFVDDPVDRGGATKYGISLRFLKAEGAFDLDADGIRDLDLDMDGDLDGEDIRKLTRGDARFLYHRCFWVPLRCEDIPRPLGEMVFDQAVNGGRGAAIKLLQRAINFCTAPDRKLISVDGRIGSATCEALHAVLRTPSKGMPALIVAYREMVKARYRLIVQRNPSQQRFLKGWLRRADELGRDA